MVKAGSARGPLVAPNPGRAADAATPSITRPHSPSSVLNALTRLEVLPLLMA